MPALESREQAPQTVYPATADKTALPSGEPPAGSGIGGIVRKVSFVVVLAALAGLGYWKLQGNKQDAADAATRTAAAANRAIPVTAVPVATRNMPIYLTALGTVTAYNTVTVKSRVDGQLMSVNVQEGQHVKQGQILATIDPSPYEATLAQAVGQLAKDQATADYAKAEAVRYKALLDAGVVSKDSQQVQESSAGQSEGVLAADRASIQAAKVNVAYSKITSPIDGVVGLRQVDAGNIVHAADTTGLIVVTQLQPIAVIFTLPEDQLPTVIQTMRAGRKLVVEAYDRSDSTHLATGTLLTLDNEIDTTTGTVKAKAIFDNRDGALFPNQFVNVRLILEERPNALVMPATALQSGANGPFVYLMKPGAPPKSAADEDGTGAADGATARPAAKRPKPATAGDAPASDAPKSAPYYVDVQNVVVDLTEGTQIILKSGLKPGDMVIVDGQEKLKRYSKVDPKQGGGRGGRGGAAASAGTAPDASAAGSLEPGETPGKRVGRGQGNAATDAALAPDHHKRGDGAGKPPAQQPQAQQPGAPQ
jgi:multidrug efflux system membrane fusion protein